MSSSCSTKPTDLRTLAPADTLVYLEANDLAAALQPIVDSKPFTEAAKSKPDLSALKGVQLAVAITGFETSEEKLSEEESVGRIQPHFVAIADTHAWHFQAVGFAEKKIGSFVANIYDSEPTVESIDKNGGKYFTWTAADGRKAYALVIDSLIYFGNDASSIEKCLAVRRGEADSIAKDGKIRSADPATLASGYISTDGVAQIANIAALKFAADASEGSEVRSAIVSIFPQIVRNSINDVTWTQTAKGNAIEDAWQVNMSEDVAEVFNKTLAPSGQPALTLLDKVPSGASATTLYNLQDPELAWRAILTVCQSKGGPAASQIINVIAPLFFEPYGIANGPAFLAATGPTFVTAGFSRDDKDELIVAAALKDEAAVQKAFDSPLKLKTVSYRDGRLDVWQSADGEVSGFFEDGAIIVGETDDLLPIMTGRREESMRAAFAATDTPASARTVASDRFIAADVASILSEQKAADLNAPARYSIETRFHKSGMERKTTSDFGFIGWIIAQLNDD